MIEDIHNEQYQSPLKSLRDAKKKSQKERNLDVSSVLWWIAFSVSGLMTFVYCIALFFTYFDNPKEFEKTFSNQ